MGHCSVGTSARAAARWARCALRVLVLGVVGIGGCTNALGFRTGLQREIILDRPPAPTILYGASVGGIEGMVLWSWQTNDPVSEEPHVFRWRANHGDWVGPVTYTTLTPNPNFSGITSGTASYIDHPGRPLADGYKILGRGSYLLEVQERSPAGVWSDSVLAAPVTVSGRLEDGRLAHFTFDTDLRDITGHWQAVAGTIGPAAGPSIVSFNQRAGGNSYLYLQGTEGAAGYLDFFQSDGALIDLDDQVTIALWMRPEYYYEENRPLIGFLGVNDSGVEVEYGGFVVQANASGGLFIEYFSANAWGGLYTTEQPTAWQEWRHVAICFDNTVSGPGAFRVFVDGQELPLTGQYSPFAGIPTANVAVRLGVIPGESGPEVFGYNGGVDDLRLYAGILSPADIAVLAGRAGALPPPPTYSITYHPNGAEAGTVPVPSGPYEAGQPVIVAGNSGGLVRTDHVFAGWSTTADATGQLYLPGQALPMPPGDLTLYARWMASATTVTIGVTLRDPLNPWFDLQPPPTLYGYDGLWVYLYSEMPMSSVLWMVNGVPIQSYFDPYYSYHSQAWVDAYPLPAGVHRVTVLVEVAGVPYSTDVLFEVVR